MIKLCPRGKAAAKRKFAVYPSAYANAYASKICAGKIKDPSGVKRKDFRGPKPAGKAMGGVIKPAKPGRKGDAREPTQAEIDARRAQRNKIRLEKAKAEKRGPFRTVPGRQRKMGGGMAMPRAMYGKGGGVCKKGMGRAYGKNS